jgi:hypothetical protein
MARLTNWRRASKVFVSTTCSPHSAATAGEEGLVDRVIAWGGGPRVTHKGLTLQHVGHIVATRIRAALVLMHDESL